MVLIEIVALVVRVPIEAHVLGRKEDPLLYDCIGSILRRLSNLG